MCRCSIKILNLEIWSVGNASRLSKAVQNCHITGIF
uniref:Uncharacterized protein n=1 Tax=Arundo donax TaxID=35708 RepID=A0A0A9A8S8_ARUDO